MKKILLTIIMMSLVLSCTKKENTTSGTATNTVENSSKFGTPLKFTSHDLNGNPVSEDLFRTSDVTLINIWATWCGPCIAEIPELGNIARKYEPEGYQVLGFIQDVTFDEPENAELALEIMQDAKADYQVIMNDKSMGNIFNDVVAFPTTFFVDSEGKMIGSEYIGAMSEAEFEKAFDLAIKQLGK